MKDDKKYNLEDENESVLIWGVVILVAVFFIIGLELVLTESPM